MQILATSLSALKRKALAISVLRFLFVPILRPWAPRYFVAIVLKYNALLCSVRRIMASRIFAFFVATSYHRA